MYCTEEQFAKPGRRKSCFVLEFENSTVMTGLSKGVNRVRDDGVFEVSWMEELDWMSQLSAISFFLQATVL